MRMYEAIQHWHVTLLFITTYTRQIERKIHFKCTRVALALALHKCQPSELQLRCERQARIHEVMFKKVAYL